MFHIHLKSIGQSDWLFPRILRKGVPLSYGMNVFAYICNVRNFCDEHAQHKSLRKTSTTSAYDSKLGNVCGITMSTYVCM